MNNKEMVKFFSLILLTIFTISFSFSQCTDAAHSTNQAASWVSCQQSLNPNNERGISHWVLYDLGYYYKISDTKFWNFNVEGQTEMGMKNMIIDFSLDGQSWSQVAVFQLSEANGSNSYSGESGPHLADIEARYILITVIDTWGSNCAGLSEVRFDISGFAADLNDVFANDDGIILYPNPTEGKFVVQGLLDSYIIEVLNSQGFLVKKLNSSHNQVIINLQDLPQGLFFIKVKNRDNVNLVLEKIIKT